MISSRLSQADWRLIHEALGPARLAFHLKVPTPTTLADRKASALITANALIISVVIFFSGKISDFVHATWPWGVVMAVAVLALVVLLVAGGMIAFICLVHPMPKPPHTFAHFSNIAAVDLPSYRQAMLAMTPAQAVRSMLNYQYSLSVQASAKFRLVQRSMACFKAAMFLWMVVLAISAFR